MKKMKEKKKDSLTVILNDGAGATLDSKNSGNLENDIF